MVVVVGWKLPDVLFLQARSYICTYILYIYIYIYFGHSKPHRVYHYAFETVGGGGGREMVVEGLEGRWWGRGVVGFMP